MGSTYENEGLGVRSLSHLSFVTAAEIPRDGSGLLHAYFWWDKGCLENLLVPCLGNEIKSEGP